MDLFVFALALTVQQPFTYFAPADLAEYAVPQHYITTSTFEDGRIQLVPQAPELIWPAVQHNLSQDFSAGHTAIDIYGKIGQPVVSMTDGTVTAITATGPYGNKIEISHPRLPDNTITVYAHLQDITVKLGQTVWAGQPIGTIGVTGNSTGPHLHFEVRHGETPIDPLTILR